MIKFTIKNKNLLNFIYYLNTIRFINNSNASAIPSLKNSRHLDSNSRYWMYFNRGFASIRPTAQDIQRNSRKSKA